MGNLSINIVGDPLIDELRPGDEVALKVRVQDQDPSGVGPAINVPVYFECRVQNVVDLGGKNRIHAETVSDQNGLATILMKLMPNTGGRSFQIRAHIGPDVKERWYTIIVPS